MAIVRCSLRLLTILAICVAPVAGVADGPPQRSAAPATPQTLTSDVQGMFDAVNARRRERGARALSIDSRLSRAAVTQAQYLARTGRLEHRGPGGSSVGDRARRAGYDWSRVAENLALSKSPSPRVIVQLWMNSRAHRGNMLNAAFTQMGGAHVGAVWVLVMARPNGRSFLVP